MNQTELLNEIRQMKFEQLQTLRTEKKLTLKEAAEILGVCERSFRRYAAHYREEGLPGLLDKRLGKAAHNAAPVDEVVRLVELYRKSYTGYSASHFFDKYRAQHAGSRSYNWVRRTLQKQGVLQVSKKRRKHRCKRPRKPMEGMMIHQDASRHEWIPKKWWDLVVTLDDATNEIYSAFFAEEEGTWSSFKGLQEVIEHKGLPCTFYTDRGSHYWHTPLKGAKVNRQRLTQFGRAMSVLGIEMIAAYSPQARGRSERMFRTLQGRLPLELKSAGIQTIAAANRFLKETFIPEFNRLKKYKALDERSAFVAWNTSIIALKDILCIHNKRVVNNDNTIHYAGKVYQLPEDHHRCSYAKCTVNVHEYEDGSISIFHGPRKLVSFENKVLRYDILDKMRVPVHVGGQARC